MATRVEPPPPARNVTPARLAELARGGSSSALGELYGLFGRALFRLAYRLSGSREDAEDIVHDVFVGLPEALQRYQERGRLDAWLRRITARVALMRLRGQRRARAVRLDPEHRHAEPVGAESAELQAAVDALPLKLRSVLVLKEIEGYSHAEIGAMLGITAVTSRVRLVRAMSQLRRRLAKGGSDDRP